MPDSPLTWLIAAGIAVCAAMAAAVFGRFLLLWFRARVSGVRVPFVQVVAMRLRGLDPAHLIDTCITARKAGLAVSIEDLERHALAGGNVSRTVRAMIMSSQSGKALSWNEAHAIDLAGHDVEQAARSAVNPGTAPD